MSTLKVTHLQNENGTGPAMSIAVGGGVTFAGISTFYGAIDLQTPTDLRVAAGATIGGSTNTITASTNGEERLRITSGGNVNIGGNFTETSHPLNISDSTKPSLCLHTGTTQRADFSATTGITSIRSFANSPFTINIGGSGETEAFRITSDGNVGIGTDTIGNISNRSQLVIGGSDGGLLDFNVGSDTEARMFATDGTGLTIRAYQSDGEIVFQTGGSTEQARITADGLKLASGNGINFSAYATSGNPSSNLLDDYEEGNFTAVLGYSNTTALSNVTIIRRSGTYIKVGSMVWFQLDIAASIAWGSISAIANGLQIQGLPFVCQPVATYQTGSSYIAINCIPRHWTTPWPTSQSPSNDPPLWKVGHNETWLTSYTSRNNNSDYVYTVADWDAAASNSTKTFEIQLYGVYSTTS